MCSDWQSPAERGYNFQSLQSHWLMQSIATRTGPQGAKSAGTSGWQVNNTKLDLSSQAKELLDLAPEKLKDKASRHVRLLKFNRPVVVRLVLAAYPHV